jgi:hypothetical protein
MNQPKKAIDDLSQCLQLKKFTVSNTGLGPMDVLAERECAFCELLCTISWEKELAQKDRAAVKAANDRTYKETVFRTRP